jgi:hypothetical protein
MIVWTTAERPVELALVFLDGVIVDGSDAPCHEPRAVELPVLVAVGPEPVAAVVVPFVGEAHRNPVAVMRPHFLDETVIQLFRPLARQKRDNGVSARQELIPISPDAVRRVGKRHPFRVTAVLGVLGHPGLLRSCF